MGVFSEYLETIHSHDELIRERKNQLRRISELRGGSTVIVYAASMGKGGRVNTGIEYDDLTHFEDQLSNLDGTQLDLIIESPGGSGEVAEDMVRLVRSRFERFCVLVPGWAKSAATIIAMGADEIVMTTTGALGPIDAQLSRNGNQFSADAFLNGFQRIKDEVAEQGVLNKAYIPILQGISPGDIENARNARDFASDLVKRWLVQYKFANWTERRSTGEPVTDEMREETAERIASDLCRQSDRWKVHGRSLKIEDLRELGIRIERADGELEDALLRYAALMKMTFDRTSAYKFFETVESQINRNMVPPAAPVKQPEGTPGGPAGPPGGQKVPPMVRINISCTQCGNGLCVQANFVEGFPAQDGCVPFPADNMIDCPQCGARIDLAPVRNELESKLKRAILA